MAETPETETETETETPLPPCKLCGGGARAYSRILAKGAAVYCLTCNARSEAQTTELAKADWRLRNA